VDAALVFIAGLGTALASGLGAIPVFMLGDRASAARPLLAGIAIGVMVVASIVGLLMPALDDGSFLEVAGGVLAGVLFVAAARAGLGTKRARAHMGRATRRSVLVFGVLFVHSLPEGFAIGAAWAADTAGLGVFVILAIAVQNIPEGTAVAVPMQAAGASRRAQFGAAVASSMPQPFGALLAFLLVEQIRALLPVSLAFAAGAMVTVVAVELVPDAWGGQRAPAFAGVVAGVGVMLALSAVLNV
jgi:zinc transporter, ZIP family